MKKRHDGKGYNLPSTHEELTLVRLEVLRALVGRIPPNPLWAELVWQRQQELGREDDTRLASPQLHR